ncbi:MAG: hypothetical protein U9P70_00470 [Patescibacteria group bacterium]|nr:hypothetical protein [Patescibacteria group bacterium]
MNTNHNRMMRGIRIILVKGVSEEDPESYYIEAGDDDGKRRFDHHNEFSSNPAPCVDDRIQRISDYSKIKITHFDADTFFALMEMLGLSRVINQELIDLDLMGKIDTNGATVLPNLGMNNSTRQYMVGLSVISGKFEFPRWNGKDIDVTEVVESLIFPLMDTIKVIRLGKEKMIQGEKAYQRCKEKTYTKGKVIFLCVEKPEDSFDGNLPFEDNYKVVVIYSRRRESISLRVRPDVDLQVSDKIFAGVPFAGHPRAAGSLRGKKFTKEQAKKVRKELEHLLS